MFSISKSNLELSVLNQAITNERAGALVTFEGWVRNHNEGHSVDSLEYESFIEMAEVEGQKVIQEALEKFKVLDIHCVHRVGHLAIGDSAVWVGAVAAHRGAAFQACKYVIDEIKHRLPIWKKEHYTNKDAEWVDCHGCASQQSHTQFTENDYYKRQITFSEMGTSGQDKLRQSKALVIGAGGLGSPVLQYLAGAGVGTIGIADGDHVDYTNLHRQVLFTTHDIGQSKADIACAKLRAMNPFIEVIPFSEHVDFENIERLVKGFDLVFDCTDNLKTKFLIHDTCQLASIPLVQASIYQMEGQLQTFVPHSDAGCYRCIYPEIPHDSCVNNCAEAGVVGATAGVLGTMQAMEGIKALLGSQVPSSGTTLLMDLKSMQTLSLTRTRNDRCPMCGPRQTIQSIHPRNYHSTRESWEVDLPTVEQMKLDNIRWVDIREPAERPENDSTKLTTLEQPNIQYLAENYSGNPTILVCNKGKKSYQFCQALHGLGYKNFYSFYPGASELN